MYAKSNGSRDMWSFEENKFNMILSKIYNLYDVESIIIEIVSDLEA